MIANQWLRLAVGLVVLCAIAVAVLTAAGVRQRRMVVWASVRAVAQLAVVAAALRGVFAAPSAVVAVIVVMFTVACLTAASRLRALEGAGSAVVVACASGSIVAVGLIVGLPVLDRTV